jgi:SPP1 family predicted phage head-tail adaptor
VRGGALRHSVQLQNETRARDAFGGVTETTTALATVWADVRPVEPEERFEAQALSVRPSHRVTIRFRSDVKQGQRLVYGGRTFNVLYAYDPDQRRRELKLLVQSETPG